MDPAVATAPYLAKTVNYDRKNVYNIGHESAQMCPYVVEFLTNVKIRC
jgi:hypothetical protein